MNAPFKNGDEILIDDLTLGYRAGKVGNVDMQGYELITPCANYYCQFKHLQRWVKILYITDWSWYDNSGNILLSPPLIQH
jgi:hypothetical protein